MKKSYFYGIWVALYALCFGLGFISNANELGQAVLIACGFLFFLPPYFLAWVSYKKADRKTLKELRYISLSAIGLFLVIYLTIFYVVASTQKMYPILEALLRIFTVPMACFGNYMGIPLFMWACLMIISLRKPAEK